MEPGFILFNRGRNSDEMVAWGLWQWDLNSRHPDELAASANQPDADPFDLLCHLAYNAPLRTRRERAERLRTIKKDFFDRYGPEARSILDELIEKYAEHGTAQFLLPPEARVSSTQLGIRVYPRLMQIFMLNYNEFAIPSMSTQYKR